MQHFKIVRNDTDLIVGFVDAPTLAIAQGIVNELAAETGFPLALIPFADQASDQVQKPATKLHIGDVMSMPDVERETFLDGVAGLALSDQADITTRLAGEALNLMDSDDLIEFRLLLDKHRSRPQPPEILAMLNDVADMVEGQLAIRRMWELP